VKDGMVISPDLNNPKKQSVAAYHSMTIYGFVFWDDQCSLSCNKIAGVI